MGEWLVEKWCKLVRGVIEKIRNTRGGYSKRVVVQIVLSRSGSEVQPQNEDQGYKNQLSSGNNYTKLTHCVRRTVETVTGRRKTKYCSKNVLINVTMRRVRRTVVAVQEQ